METHGIEPHGLLCKDYRCACRFTPSPIVRIKGIISIHTHNIIFNILKGRINFCYLVRQLIGKLCTCLIAGVLV